MHEYISINGFFSQRKKVFPEALDTDLEEQLLTFLSDFVGIAVMKIR
jgi:hypothetical protein